MSEGLFRYDEAFARNIGWVTEAEQASLRGKRVAIAGVGGVGGVHLLSLARLGVVILPPAPGFAAAPAGAPPWWFCRCLARR